MAELPGTRLAVRSCRPLLLAALRRVGASPGLGPRPCGRPGCWLPRLLRAPSRSPSRPPAHTQERVARAGAAPGPAVWPSAGPRGANAWTARKVRGVSPPRNSQEENSTGKVRAGRRLRPRPGSWSQQRSDRHATGHTSALSHTPGHDGKDRQTDRQCGALRASAAARSGPVWTGGGGSPVHT